MQLPYRLGVATAFLVLALPAFSQPTADSDYADEDERVLEVVRVTGSHIKRIDTEGPAPVMIFDGLELEQSGIVTLEEATRYLPINFAQPYRPWGATGHASFNLRGLGLGATLTLVNGLRLASNAWWGDGVDVNSIPISAIERIEILKDGASALYGADAIAGVVNIILRRDYDGIEVSAGYGISEHGDAEEALTDLVAGWDFERGSVMFSLSYLDREPVPMRDRDWSSEADYSRYGGPNTRSPNSSPPTVLRYDTFTWQADPACGTDPLLTAVGEYPWGEGSACLFNWAQYQGLVTGQERLGVTASGTYELGPRLRLVADLFYTEQDAENKQAPAPVHGSPLLPTYTGRPYVPAEHPDNPFGTAVEIAYRTLDVGNRVYLTHSRSWRLALGLEGVWGDWDWTFSLLGSRNQVDLEYVNVLPQTRFQEALLGRGGPQGNLWYNPFGYGPQNDPELLDWLKVVAVSENTWDEHSADLLLDRYFGELPGGPVGVAFGLQYREQEQDQWADEYLRSGDLAGILSEIPVSVDRDLVAAYVEFSLPLLDSLEAQLALRWEDYSDFGSTTNPKVAMRWQPADWIMLRGSWATSFRAPSFWLLYAPTQTFWDYFSDPVRCAHTGLPEDCEPSVRWGVWAGNPDLGPEEGESWFAGLHWTPGFLPGFELQLDYWKFIYDERIAVPTAATVLESGFDWFVERAPTEPDGTPGRILSFRETPINLDRFLTDGIDTSARYAWQTDRAGDFEASLLHTYVSRWVYTETLLWYENVNLAGKNPVSPGIPRNRGNLNLDWSLGPHGAAANLHYFGHYEFSDTRWVAGEEIDEPLVVPSQTTLDLQYSYTFEKLRDARLRIGCINCTGETPPLTFARPHPFVDWRGRMYYLRWQQPLR
jgi:outer membrane receptor protein involved in Fe transport